MNKAFALTLDLEPEHAGLIKKYEIFKDKAAIERLLDLLHSFNVKITVFVVAQLLESHPDIIALLENYPCEFEIHSYSHNHAACSPREEIEKARKAYRDYFHKDPKGYRAPCGRISKETIRLLEENGFLYDSSVFPSYYPNPLRYLFSNKDIHYINGSGLMEIPLSSITPFRLTLSLSYLKLLGIDAYRWMMNAFTLPEVICFNTHLHDFIVDEDTIRKLPAFWRFVYSRNKFKGIEYFVEFMNVIKKREYEFYFMSEVYERHKINRLPTDSHVKK